MKIKFELGRKITGRIFMPFSFLQKQDMLRIAVIVNGRDKLSQKWSFKSEPLWKGCGIDSTVFNLIPG
jgi:hypothetical protein